MSVPGVFKKINIYIYDFFIYTYIYMSQPSGWNEN